MLDISANPRLLVLVSRVERMFPGLDHGGADAASRAKIQASYQEIGRYVHWLLRQDRAATAEILATVASWAEDSEGEEPEDDVPTLRDAWLTPPPAADEEEPVEDEFEPMEISAPPLAFGEEEAPADQLREAVSVSLRSAASALSGVSFAVSAGEPDWVEAMRDLLRILGEPGMCSAEDEGRHLLDTTTSMELRWLAFPPSAQLALLGMLASRARAIEPMLGEEGDVARALGRLQRYRESLGLSLVPALAEPPIAEYGSWAEDARMWWSILASAIPAER